MLFKIAKQEKLTYTLKSNYIPLIKHDPRQNAITKTVFFMFIINSPLSQFNGLLGDPVMGMGLTRAQCHVCTDTLYGAGKRVG